MVNDGSSKDITTRNRLIPLIFLLNIILLGSLLYATFARALIPGGGVSIVLANDLLSPMVELSLTYPGGAFTLPRLDARKSVGNPIPVSGAFDATLSFQDGDGNRISQSFPIKPVGEFLIVIHVLPEYEETVVRLPEGKDEKFYKPSASKVKILTTYQGENVNI